MPNYHSLVSVVIPVFNGARHVLKAIESVEHQTFRDLEIIVVDDGSTDDTKAVLGGLVKNEEIHYVHQKNKGLSGARNTGIRLARGKYLKFLDHDDLLYPEQLERQVNHLRDKRDQVISVSGFELEFESGNRRAYQPSFDKGNQLVRFIENNQFPVHAALVSRDAVQRAGYFDETLRACEDLDLWLRLLLQGGNCEVVDYIGCCYRILSGSLSADPNKQFLQLARVYEKVNVALTPQLSELSDEIAGQLLSSNAKRAHQSFARKINPAACMPMAIEVSQKLYAKKINGLKKVVLNLLGMQKMFWLQYLRANLKDWNYSARLARTTWRDERSHS